MNPRRRAMTMLELTIVILVLGILAALAAPRFGDSVRGAMLQAAARQMASHIDRIRNTAINEGRTTTLVCNNVTHEYASTDVDFAERLGVLISVSLTRSYDPTLTLNANFDTQQQLTFDFEGVPHVGGTPLSSGRIILASGEDVFWVRIATGTGRTSVLRPPTTVDGTSGASG